MSATSSTELAPGGSGPAGQAANAEQGSRRVSIEFSQRAFEILNEISALTGKTKADVLRDALSLEHWAQQEILGGGRILIERNGEVRELLLR
jgi:hypothetical protein